MSERGWVTVAGVPALVVVSSGGRGVGHRHEGPGIADCGKPVVLDPAVGDDEAAPGCSGDGGGAGVGLERSGIDESVGVVADLGEDVGAGEFTETGEAGDYVVWGARSRAWPLSSGDCWLGMIPACRCGCCI